MFPIAIQGDTVGFNSGNGEKQSYIQAEPGQLLGCIAYFQYISGVESYVATLCTCFNKPRLVQDRSIDKTSGPSSRDAAPNLFDLITNDASKADLPNIPAGKF